MLKVDVSDLKTALLSVRNECSGCVLAGMLETRIKQAESSQEAQRLAKPQAQDVDIAALERALTTAREVDVSEDILQPLEEKQLLASNTQHKAALLEMERLAAPSLQEIMTMQLMQALGQARAAGVATELITPLQLKLRDASVTQALQLLDVESDVLAVNVEKLEEALQLAHECGAPPDRLAVVDAACRQAIAAQKAQKLASEELLKVGCLELEQALQISRDTDVPPHILYPCDERWRQAAAAQLQKFCDEKFPIGIDIPSLERAQEMASRAGVAQDVLERGRAKIAEAQNAQKAYQLYRGASKKSVAGTKTRKTP